MMYRAVAPRDTIESVRYTIAYLRTCQKARALGWQYPNDYSLTRDPEWLVNMAINRRAGWPEDRHTRACSLPVVRFDPGFMVAPIWQFPKRAADGGDIHPSLVHRINSRSIVREREVPRRYRAKLAHKLYTDDDF